MLDNGKKHRNELIHLSYLCRLRDKLLFFQTLTVEKSGKTYRDYRRTEDPPTGPRCI
jgi:hypothetical protein